MGEIIGNYEVVAELKRGGMGVVYAAQHRTMGQRAVVKKVLPEHSANHDIVQRFFQEATAAAALDDPGVVRIFDQGVLADGSAYIVMEFLQGESLADRLARDRRVPVDRALTFVRQAARAVGKAHSQRIIHRDLKPDNLFIVSDPDVPGGERIKVLDFGIAKLGEGGRVKTMTQMPMGTPGYMSPEQWASAGRVDARTDVYAFGVILFEMLTGHLPFPGPGLTEFIDQHRFAPVPAASAFDPALAPFDGLLARAMAKSADDRFASLDELIAALPGGGISMQRPAVTAATAPTMVPSTASAAPIPSTLGGSAAAVAATSAAAKGGSGLLIGGLAVALAAVGVTVAVLASGGDPPDPPPPGPAPVEVAAMTTVDAAAAVVVRQVPIDAGVAIAEAPAVDAGVEVAEVAEVVDAGRAASARATDPRRSATVPKSADAPKATHGSCLDEVACMLADPRPACCARYGGGKVSPPPPPPGLDESLTREQILAGVGKIKGAAAACGAKSSAKGTVKLSVKVDGSGRVADVAVKQSPDPTLGACAAAAMKRATFAKTQLGGTFAYPFVF
ncbi:MAG: serine/threonine protein kinase [Myxococcales bacterium]|nr:serine/threonine protein kinase [Myxococcales bacterium]